MKKKVRDPNEAKSKKKDAAKTGSLEIGVDLT